MYIERAGYRSTLIEWSLDRWVVPNERDDESGQFRQQYPTEDFLSAVREMSMATTSKVAERVGCSYDLAYRRLNSLADEEAIVRTDVGGSFIWTVDEE